MAWMFRGFIALISLGFLGLIAGIAVFVWILFYYSEDLPAYSQLADYEPAIITRVHTSDGRLMAEFAQEKRIFLPIREVPEHVIQAFLSAEDKNFYTHPGIDIFGVARALYTNISNMGSGRRPEGASTITQQVAKNFLLSGDVSYERKVQEALLAFRIERAFTKDQILELYLNEIYMGMGTYGVAAAALNYFGKTLDQVTVEEAAYLAALPKAPNNYHPRRNYETALARRNWVLSRMAEDGHITEEERAELREKPLETVQRAEDGHYAGSSYFAEEVRRILINHYGEHMLYKGGLVVHTSLVPELQQIAARALRNGLVTYDRRHGRHREHIAKFENMENWQEDLRAIPQPVGAEDWRLAAVLSATKNRAEIGFSDGRKGIIPLDNVTWARERLSSFSRGPAITEVTQVLNTGDVILTERTGEKTDDGQETYHYRQIPEIQGGIIAMDPHTGRILAMVGGFSYEISEFNRATQALRQPGSAFKPVIYTAALEAGYTPATLVLDAPFVLDQGYGLGKWRPSNYSGEFYGPTTLRVGLEKSRNLMTVRLAHQLGMERIAEVSKRLGIIEDLQPVLSMSLGAGETTLLRMVRGYATFVNGGKQVTPSFIDRIQNRHGKTVARNDRRPCEYCGPLIEWENQETPQLPDIREQILDPRHAYQMVSIMEGAVERGTAMRLRSLRRPLAGKTGTTNEAKDTWFIGFTPDLVVGIYIGFDRPRPMGRQETGSRVAVPIFQEFMEAALEDTPPVPFRVPPGVRLVQINAADGTRARPHSENTIWEAFLHGTEPSDRPVIFDGQRLVPVEAQGDRRSGAGVYMGTGDIY